MPVLESTCFLVRDLTGTGSTHAAVMIPVRLPDSSSAHLAGRELPRIFQSWMGGADPAWGGPWVRSFNYRPGGGNGSIIIRLGKEIVDFVTYSNAISVYST
jgi:hypothetical protein